MSASSKLTLFESKTTLETQTQQQKQEQQKKTSRIQRKTTITTLQL